VALGDKKMTVLKEAFNLTRREVGYINRVGYEELTKQKSIRHIEFELTVCAKRDVVRFEYVPDKT